MMFRQKKTVKQSKLLQLSYIFGVIYCFISDIMFQSSVSPCWNNNNKFVCYNNNNKFYKFHFNKSLNAYFVVNNKCSK